jgi:hypothetical protein
LHAKVKQFAFDALVAPAGILGGQADDQSLHVIVELGATWATMRIAPCAGDQAAVPAQQGLRLDQEAGPAGPGQHAADGGEQGPVGRLEPWSWNLTAQHGELVRSTRVSRSLAVSLRASRSSSWIERQSIR